MEHTHNHDRHIHIHTLSRHFPLVEGLTLIPDHSEAVCCNLHPCAFLNCKTNQPLTSGVGSLHRNRGFLHKKTRIYTLTGLETERQTGTQTHLSETPTDSEDLGE